MPALTYLAFISRSLDIPDGEAESDVSDDLPVVKEGLDLALSRPFIFLGLTVLGLLGVVLLFVYFAYRIVKAWRMKCAVIRSSGQYPVQKVSCEDIQEPQPEVAAARLPQSLVRASSESRGLNSPTETKEKENTDTIFQCPDTVPIKHELHHN